MAKNKGYVSIWRDIQDNDLWTSEPFSKGQAWIDLILMANHEEKSFLLGTEVIKAEVGSVITSELKLMNKWKWSKKKLRNFLKLLEVCNMIERRPDKRKTTIVILNYEKYQKKETTEETTTKPLFIRGGNNEETTEDTTKRPQRDHKETTEDTQTITINNYTITKNKERESVCRHKYGEYNNVLLSDEEIKKLREEAPDYYLEKLEALSSYMKSTGKSYKSHYATIRNWIRKDQKKEGEKSESEEKGKVFNLEDFL